MWRLKDVKEKEMACNENGAVIGWWSAGVTYAVSHYGKVTDESFGARKEGSGTRVCKEACNAVLWR